MSCNALSISSANAFAPKWRDVTVTASSFFFTMYATPYPSATTSPNPHVTKYSDASDDVESRQWELSPYLWKGEVAMSRVVDKFCRLNNLC